MTEIKNPQARAEALLRRLESAHPHIEEAVEDLGSVTSLAIAVEVLSEVIRDLIEQLADTNPEPDPRAPVDLTPTARVITGRLGPARHAEIVRAMANTIDIHCWRCRALVDSADACTRCGADQVPF